MSQGLWALLKLPRYLQSSIRGFPLPTGFLSLLCFRVTTPICSLCCCQWTSAHIPARKSSTDTVRRTHSTVRLAHNTLQVLSGSCIAMTLTTRIITFKWGQTENWWTFASDHPSSAIIWSGKPEHLTYCSTLRNFARIPTDHYREDFKRLWSFGRVSVDYSFNRTDHPSLLCLS